MFLSLEKYYWSIIHEEIDSIHYKDGKLESFLNVKIIKAASNNETETM